MVSHHYSHSLTRFPWPEALPVRAECECSRRILKNPPWSISAETLPVRYLIAVSAVVAIAALAVVLGPLVSEDNDMLLFLGTLILLSLRLGRGPSLVACVLSLTFLSFGRAHSGFAINSSKFEYLISFALFLFTTHIVSTLSTRVQLEAWREQQRAEALKFLHEFSQSCSQAANLQELEQFTRRMLFYNLGLESSDSKTPEAVQFSGIDDDFGVLARTGAENNFWRGYLHSLRSLYLDSVQRIQQAEKLRETSIHEETQRLQSALINSVSHDIQTPLASILGTFELLRDPSLELPPMRRQKLLVLGHSQTQRLLQFCRNMLHLGKLEGGALKPMCVPLTLDEAIPAALELLDPHQRSRIEVRLQSDDVWVLGDRLLLTQIVFNLIDNALKFSRPSEPVVVTVSRSRDKARVTVADLGVGVLPEEHHLIFQRFQRGTAPERIPGSGLGLHISRELALLHNGSLKVQNRSARGSRFTLSLPLHETHRVPTSTSGHVNEPQTVQA